MRPQFTSSTPKLTPIRGRVSKTLDLICRHCGLTFTVYRHEAETRRQAFCSNKCRGESVRMPMPPRDEIVGLYEQGVSTNGLAFHYKVSKGTIYNWLKAYGIKTRTNGAGVTLARTGKEHSTAWNAAIGAGNRGKPRDYMVGHNNPVFAHSSTGMHYSRGGTRADLGIYVRSSWEANYCRYLEWLRARGEIAGWAYEVDTFWFHTIKRGTRSYTPDFKVTNPDGSIEYHEVKGRMDQTSRTKLDRMRRYYPEVKIVLIEKDAYKAIAKWKALIPHWEAGHGSHRD